MKKQIAFLCALAMSAPLVAAPDEELFLEPHLKSELAQVSGHAVLDAGCGVGLVSAAQSGAVVCGIAAQSKVLEKAQLAVAQAGVERQVELCKGDMDNLPYEAQKFDQALSINAGCDLQRTMQTISATHYAVSGLGAHFREMQRVLKEGGQLLVAAPASFGVVFTDGKHSPTEVMNHIESVLANIGSSQDSDTIINNLKELDEVHRATFVHRGGQLVLVTDENELATGEQIWRKNPDSVDSQYYHSEEEYLVAIHNAGLKCEEIKRPCFFGNVKYKAFRAESDALGEAYIENHPFTIYCVSKQG